MPKKTTSPAYVLGVGLTKFIKPRGKVDYTELGFEVRLLGPLLIFLPSSNRSYFSLTFFPLSFLGRHQSPPRRANQL